MAKLIDRELYSETIKKVIVKEMTQKEEALKLNITDRQVRRLIVKYEIFGDDAFTHKNKAINMAFHFHFFKPYKIYIYINVIILNKRQFYPCLLLAF